MRFTKVQGLGNDFILIEAFNGLPSADLAGLARSICHRHFGVGADGLVLLRPSQIADFRMQIINSDGSEAEMCGNAIRCAAKYAYEHGLCRWTELSVETLAGIMQIKLAVKEGCVESVTADMGLPILDPERIPMQTEQNPAVLVPVRAGEKVYRVTALLMGVPHAVVFVPDLEKVDIAQDGYALEKHAVFPRGTNVEFVRVVNPELVKVKVWERGAGLTLACGTGACAVAVACVLNGLTEDQITVALPGGALHVHWRNHQRVLMTGPAVEVFSGDWPETRLAFGNGR